MSLPKGEEGLLAAVWKTGWTPARQRAFLRRYGPPLRRVLLGELGRLFGPSALRGLSRYLEALERATEMPSTQGIAGHLLELACDTWQAVWLEIFKPEGGTIVQYADYCGRCAREGRKALPFLAYLCNLVKLKLRQQLPRHREIFAPVRMTSGSADLEDEGGRGEAWEEALEAPGRDVPTQAAAPEADDLDRRWEELLRCREPAPEALDPLLRLHPAKEPLLCWACCSLKRRLTGRRRENLVAFVAFFVSQQGPQREREPLPSREELSLLTLRGKYLRWEEDICRIFQKSIRKDRVMAQLREELLRSPYRDALDGGAKSSGGSPTGTDGDGVG